MAHHASAKKRIRQSAKRRLLNRYQGKTTRNAIKELRTAKTPAEFIALPKVLGMIDKLAKNNIIHRNKASRLKSQLMRKANKTV